MGNVMNRYTNAFEDNFNRVVRCFCAIVVYGLSLLIAIPFFAVLFAPFYMGNF